VDGLRLVEDRRREHGHAWVWVRLLMLGVVRVVVWLRRRGVGKGCDVIGREDGRVDRKSVIKVIGIGMGVMLGVLPNVCAERMAVALSCGGYTVENISSPVRTDRK
jgi:hypothetical protein